jgi:hypothetical protein
MAQTPTPGWRPFARNAKQDQSAAEVRRAAHDGFDLILAVVMKAIRRRSGDRLPVGRYRVY